MKNDENREAPQIRMSSLNEQRKQVCLTVFLSRFSFDLLVYCVCFSFSFFCFV
jgi:hypothetical protein